MMAVAIGLTAFLIIALLIARDTYGIAISGKKGAGRCPACGSTNHHTGWWSMCLQRMRFKCSCGRRWSRPSFKEINQDD